MGQVPHGSARTLLCAYMRRAQIRRWRSCAQGSRSVTSLRGRSTPQISSSAFRWHFVRTTRVQEKVT